MVGLSENSDKMHETVTNRRIGASPKNRTCQDFRTNFKTETGRREDLGPLGYRIGHKVFQKSQNYDITII